VSFEPLAWRDGFELVCPMRTFSEHLSIRPRPDGSAQHTAEEDRRPGLPGARAHTGAGAGLRKPASGHMHRWLDSQVGRGSYAVHGAGEGLTHATAWYFRTVEEAQAFVRTFPMLELADGTELPTYQSPCLPFGRGADRSDPVCNLYSMLKSQEAMRRLFDGLIDRAGNMPPLPGIYPDYSAPVIRNSPEGRELVMARWGMTTPPHYLVGKDRSGGHQYPAGFVAALAAVAGAGPPLPGTVHQLRREQSATR
jgi:hypothetical protein